MIALAAVSKNNVIGKDGKLPFSCKADLKFFKKMTWGRDVVFGRKTFEKMPHLEGRRAWVISRSNEIFPKDNWPYKVTSRIHDVPQDSVICGGAEIYKSYLPFLSEFLLTTVEVEVRGDTYLPQIYPYFRKWEVIEHGEAEGSQPEYRIYRYFN